MLAVNKGETKDQVRAYITQHRLNFPHWMDADSAAERAFAVDAIPRTFLIDRQGRIVRRFSGRRDWAGRLERQLIRYLIDGGGDSTLVWSFRDACNDRHDTQLRFFEYSDPNDRKLGLSGQRPGGNQVYKLTGTTQTYRLGNCMPGAKVCYGARPYAPNSTRYWGVSLDGDESCQDCCYICPASGAQQIESTRSLSCS